MVLTYSRRISRVLRYSGYSQPSISFAYETFTLSCLAFQLYSTTNISAFWSPLPQKNEFFWFGLLRFRSPLLTQSLIYFLFLRLMRCFSSPGSPHIAIYSLYDNILLHILCSHIRTSTDQRSFATPRSFSQLVTSFFGA